MVGHLRPEKDPLTFMRAAQLATHPSARFIHIGGALDPQLGARGRSDRRAPTRATSGWATWRTTPPAPPCRAAMRW